MTQEFKCELIDAISVRDIQTICAIHGDEPNFSIKFKVTLKNIDDKIRIPKIAEMIIGVDQNVDLYFGDNFLCNIFQTQFPKLHLLGLYCDLYVKTTSPFITLTFEFLTRTGAKKMYEKFTETLVRINKDITLEYNRGIVTKFDCT